MVSMVKDGRNGDATAINSRRLLYKQAID